MFKFLMIICLIGFLLVSLLGISVIRSFKEFFLGSPKSKDKQRASSQSRQNSQTKNSTKNRKKVINADEGEYVDYVEIKE